MICLVHGGFDSTFEDAAAEDTEDLVDLLAIVPFNALIDNKVMLLNPIFGKASPVVGGADADLIAGDMLVDIKTSKRDTMAATHLDQLFGYYLLACRHRQSDPTFPIIKRLAIYFARHGHLSIWDATTWTEHPSFTETEQWFFDRAKEVFQVNKSQPKKPAAPQDLAALDALKKQFEENRKLMCVSRSDPKGTEWVIKRASVSPQGSLWLSVVPRTGVQQTFHMPAHQHIADGTLRFDSGIGKWIFGT